jgi:hypothetical protein
VQRAFWFSAISDGPDVLRRVRLPRADYVPIMPRKNAEGSEEQHAHE